MQFCESVYRPGCSRDVGWQGPLALVCSIHPKMARWWKLHARWTSQQPVMLQMIMPSAHTIVQRARSGGERQAIDWSGEISFYCPVSSAVLQVGRRSLGQAGESLRVEEQA